MQKIKRQLCGCLAALLLTGGSMGVWAATPAEVIPIGRAAGIKMSADGVMVVRLSGVSTAAGEAYPAKQAGLREGDLIVSAKGEPVSSNTGLQRLVTDGKPIALQIRREGKAMDIEITPVQDTAGQYKLGVMVRDSMAGIGTITYVDPATGAYGSLGHGICDLDTGVLLPLGKGSVMEAAVSSVEKGAAGKPGELKGEFNLQHDMGTVDKNTRNGVFGVLSDDSYYHSLAAMPVASRDEVRPGEAHILSNIENEQAVRYTVEILKIYDEDEDMGMLIKVTDPALLRATGGIVQGMSGSPVIQNGKLIGAVTHVLVNDPTKGYAIFLEKMLAEMEK